ncbi:MAG: peroxide stress protein YaaA [Bacteroidetes bacterium]|nr:peroxide stress protein YaaA [Bacteroidota bacterium]
MFIRLTTDTSFGSPNITFPIQKQAILLFKDKKNGDYKIISIYAKKARGLMSQFVIRNKIENVDDLKFFDEDSYYYNNELSHGNQIVFTRG